MSRRLLAAALLLAAVTAPAGLRAQRSSGAGAGLDSATSEAVGRVLDGARAAGLPAGPIVAKVRLGMLRHAPDSVILAAAQAVAARLLEARRALGPLADPADLAAGADALGTGVTADGLRMVRAAAGNGAVAVPLGVLAELTASGVSAGRAAAIITALVRRHAPARELVALGNDVNADVRAGAVADASLGVRVQRLEAILTVRTVPSATSLPTATGTGR